MTDEQAVKGRWPEAYGAFGHIWSGGDNGFSLGFNWHEARQHPSVVEWERDQVTPKELEQWQKDLAVLPEPLRDALDGLVRVFAHKEATIAEQAARIEELQKMLRLEAAEASWARVHRPMLADCENALYKAEARIAELEKWHTQSARLVDAYKERAERAEVELEKAGKP